MIKKQYLNVVFFILLLISSFSVFSYSFSIHLTLLLSFFGFIYIIILSNKISHRKFIKLFVFFYIFLGFILLNILITYFLYDLTVGFDTLKFFLRFFLVFSLSYLLSSFLTLKSLETGLWILTIHALIGFLLQFLIDARGLPVINYSVSGEYARTLFHTFHYSQYNPHFNFYRNQGIFWEPGVLQIIINLLLFITLYYRHSIKKSIFLTFILLSTFSTTGIIITFLLWMNYFFKRKGDFIIFFAIALILFFIINFSNSDFIEHIFLSKFDINSSVSFYLRLFDLFKSIDVFTTHPFGIGFNPEVYINYKYDFNLFETKIDLNYFLDEQRGLTNSVLDALVKLGIFALLYFIFLYKQQFFIKNKKIFFTLLFFSLLSEPIIFGNFIIFLLATSSISRNKHANN